MRPRPVARIARARRTGRWIALAPVLLAAVFAVGTPARGSSPDAGDPEGPGPLPWRVTGRIEYTVDAASFPDSAANTLEVYVRVPPVTLARLARDESGAGRLRLSLRVTNRFGGRPQERSQDFSFAGQDTGEGLGRVGIMRYE